ncbi:MAG: hypothetical protein AABY27_03630, partial [Pseudomonadota bacterium]
MLKFLRKDKKKLDFALNPTKEQCIPYACHFDDYTLLTKNGELMQVIRIEGFSENRGDNQTELDIRSLIRKAIVENISDTNIALYFHTIRQKRNLDSVNRYPWTFAKDNHEGWAKKNYWREKFINELYITIIYKGEEYNSEKNIFLSLIPNILKRSVLNNLERKSKTLDETILKLLLQLEKVGAKRLQVSHDTLGAHSEQLEFISRIASLRYKRVPLPVQGIDGLFTPNKIAFGGNSLEVVDKSDKHFAAIFSIKEYHETDFKILDPLLRIASEFVITQTFNFVNPGDAKKHFEYLDYILNKVGKDEELLNNSGLKSTLSKNNDKDPIFGTQQMYIMVMGNTLKELQRCINTVVTSLKSLGIVIVREDLNIALAFWSQLPGNFHFFRRSSYINIEKTAGFTSLYNLPSGRTKNIWGKAVTLFRRENASPHFFNFHVDNNGNTLVVGRDDSSKCTLVNFLLSESSKYEPNVLFIDQKNTSNITIKALGGRYEKISLEETKPRVTLNPFSMKDTLENKEFLEKFLSLLLFPEILPSKEHIDIIHTAIESIFSKVEAGKRQLSSFVNLIDNEEIKNLLSPWCKPNQFGILFDNSFDDLDSGSKILGLNIAQLLAKENSRAVPA